MLSKSLLLAAAWSALTAGLAQAAPLEKRADNADDVPWYCKPVNMLNGMEKYSYLDLSEECQRNGYCDNLCITTHLDGSHKPVNDQDIVDLQNAIGQQSLKDSRFKFTYVGTWQVGYTDWLGTDLFPSEMLQIYFHTVGYIPAEGSGKLEDITFNWHQGGKSNVMVAARDVFA